MNRTPLFVLVAICGLTALVASRMQPNHVSARSPSVVHQQGEQAAASRLIEEAMELRRLGPSALDELFDRREDLVDRIAEQSDSATKLRQRLAELDRLIDLVGGQRYCSASRLFWHTDIEKAKQVAGESNLPILSLRMLGNLTDEYSCANSRFFRTTLYANEEVSKFLRENFVLHWKSVRPVPKVTIDFGDGRRLERTLTGNSIHYVLTADGRVVDGLPGLYSPQKFLALLKNVAPAAKALAQTKQLGKEPGLFEQTLQFHHQQQLGRVVREWENDLRRAKVALAAKLDGPKPVAHPPAEAAAVIARPKSAIEMVLIPQVTMRVKKLEEETSEGLWEAIAQLHSKGVQLDDSSRDIIVRENGRSANDEAINRMLGNLRSSIAIDTVRNEYQLHRQLHLWFAENKVDIHDVDALNERVYAELFLTPDSDPWLGLIPDDTYTALENNGIIDSEE